MEKTKELNSDTTITIGDLARRMDVTVRTLQYYDREGLLKPSATTSGGRRFYTKNDVVRLHQILSMKYLGFSLDDIKNRLTTLDTPQDVIKALEMQRIMLKEQIEKFDRALSATEALQTEAMQMQTVDFDSYANIILLLMQKSDSYWIFKLLNEKLLYHVNERFSANLSAWATLFERWKNACDTTILLDNSGEDPAGKRAQDLAGEWWDITLEFTGGNLSLLHELDGFEAHRENWSEEMKNKLPLVVGYRKKILTIYFKMNGITLP